MSRNFCDKKFTVKCNLYRHQKHFCKEKYDKDEELRLANLKIEKLEKEKEDLFDLAKNNSQTASKSMSAMSFVVKNCKNAPEIKKLEGKETLKLITHDKKSTYSIERLLIHHFDKKNLHEYIGNMIVTFYKKKNQLEQSVWTSDVAILNFLLCQSIEGTNKVEWIKDKSGVKLTSLVIEPVLDRIKEMLVEYIRTCHEIIVTETIGEMEKRINNMNTINLKKLHKLILKYIAPKFNLNMANI